MLPFSVEVLLSLIAIACIAVSIAFNEYLPPFKAWAASANVGTLLAVLIYTAPRTWSEGWSGFIHDISHLLFWIVAFIMSNFYAGLTTLIIVGIRRWRKHT